MPDWKRIVRERLSGLTLDGAQETEIVDELAQHLEDRYEALRSAGVTASEAHRKAIEELQDGELLARELQKIRQRPAAVPIGIPQKGKLMSGLATDLKIALRNMRTKLAFSLMVVGMLALVPLHSDPARIRQEIKLMQRGRRPVAG